MSTHYISTGELTRMYTLRVRYMDTASIEGESYNFERDEYIRNLSIDSQRAKAAAEEHLSNMYGENNYTLSLEELPSLEEIRRGENDARRIAREAREAELDIIRNQELEIKLDKIAGGVWPFGIYRDEPFENARNSYILYWINLDETDTVTDLLAQVLRKKFPQLSNMPEPNGAYYGEEKSREEFTATCIARFSFEGYYGWVDVIKFVKDSGELLMYMGSGNVECDLADTVTFTATVKSHEEYDGEAQTKIQRITKLKKVL